MIDLYPAYKPFRNYMSRLSVAPSLLQLWGYFIYIAEKRALPANLALGKPANLDPRTHLHPWDLEILVREVILNAGSQGMVGLHQWKVLADAVNHIRRLEDAPYSGDEDRADIMVDLQRMAHRQFRWQSGHSKRAAQIVRAWKIFGSPELEAKVQAQIGMNMSQLLRLGMAATGLLLKQPFLNVGTDFSAVGVPRDASRQLLERLSCDLKTLKEDTRNRQQYNDAWLYVPIPLEYTPLIRLDPAKPDNLLCPIPRYLLDRVTSGVFYDIVNSDGFSNAYGDAFQTYVGEVLATTLQPPDFRVLEERPYAERKAELKHGVDWIVSDSSGHLFIECKTKRLSLGAKNVTDPEAVSRDLAAMTQAIIQNYKNIVDAKKGLTEWVPDDLPVYPLVVTLEDWHLFSTHFTAILRDEVNKALAQEAMDLSLVDTIPYTVTSVSELETVLQVVAARGIDPIFAKKTAPEFRDWAWVGFLPTHFSEEFRSANSLLFFEDAQRLIPELKTEN